MMNRTLTVLAAFAAVLAAGCNNYFHDILDWNNLRVATPQITAQPQGAAYVTGAAAAPLAVGAAAGDGGALTYQWYKNSAESNSGGAAIDGATAAAFDPPTDAAGGVWYYAVVTNRARAAGREKTASATSDTAKVEVINTKADGGGTIGGWTPEDGGDNDAN